MDSDQFTGISYDRDLLHHQPPPDYVFLEGTAHDRPLAMALRDSTERLTEAIEIVESRGYHHRCVKAACAPCADHEILQIHSETYLKRIKYLDGLDLDKRTEELIKAKER